MAVVMNDIIALLIYLSFLVQATLVVAYVLFCLRKTAQVAERPKIVGLRRLEEGKLAAAAA